MTASVMLVGDVHGCLAELDDLLARLSPAPGDRLFFLGDLITRGPDSTGVVRRVRHLLAAYPGSACLAGNHELALVRARAGASPGAPPDPAAWSAADWRFFETLPLVVRLPAWDAVLVHAGFAPTLFTRFGGLGDIPATWMTDTGARADALRECVWIKRVTERGEMAWPPGGPDGRRHWSDVYRGEAGFCFYGHDPSLDPPEPRVSPHAIGLDTGCCYGGRLTAAVLRPGDDPARPTFASVPARARYAEPPATARASAPGPDPR